MTTDAETFERIREPLEDRGIVVEHVQAKERSLRVSGDDLKAEFDGFDVGFVYPSRMMEGAVVDTRLSVPWVNDREAVLTSRNKAGVIASLDTAGVPTPRTTLISNPTDESTVIDAVSSFSYPVVVKPNSATRGVGVTTAQNLDALLGVVDYLNLIHDYRATGDKSYVIQEFIPNARDYRAMVVDGAYAGAVRRQLPEGALAAGRWKHNVHRGAEASGVTLPAHAKRLAEKTAEVLDIPYLGVDLLETDDRIVVNETNARPTIDAVTKYDPGFYDRLAGLITQTAEVESK